ncbi:hypothetical protein I4U23_027376 [Adineta vaga]|nr:hypothetical protein I4U23_027376 [Adineta vaga]
MNTSKENIDDVQLFEKKSRDIIDYQSPTLLLKIKLYSQSNKSHIDDRSCFITLNKYRIIALQLIDYVQDPFPALFFSLDDSFYHLESLILYNTPLDIFNSILSSLSCLSRLVSLTVHNNNTLGMNNLYTILCSSSSLKYFLLESLSLYNLISILSCTTKLTRLVCKSIFEHGEYIDLQYAVTLPNLRYLSIDDCQMIFDHFELFMMKLSFELQVLRIKGLYNIAYINAERWERLFTISMPCLRVFDIQLMNNNNDEDQCKTIRPCRIIDLTDKILKDKISNSISTSFDPIIGYGEESVLSLRESCQSLINIIYNISYYVEIALNNTSSKPSDGLTIDESASIRLYTMEWGKEPPFEGANFYPEPKKRSWYRKKTFQIPICLFAMLIIAAIIIASVLGTKSKKKKIIDTTIRWDDRNWAYSCDFNGNDISNVSTSAPTCGGKCYDNRNCTHFTWTEINGGTCFMKGGNVTREDAFFKNDPTMICGIAYTFDYMITNKTLDWQKNNQAIGCDFPGNDISNIISIGTDCAGICSTTPPCSHFIWNKYNGGTCFMKKGNMTKQDAIATNDLNMICGLI